MHASKNDGAAIEDDGREYERGFDMKGVELRSERSRLE